MKWSVQLVRRTHMWLAEDPGCLLNLPGHVCRCASFPTLPEAMTYAARRSTLKDRPPELSGGIRRT